MKLKFAILILLSLAALIVFPLLGSTDVLHDPMGREILMKLRIPRVLTAFLAGIALATSGMIFQALFRNPLATPDTLGVSGGAALGATVWMRFGAPLLFAGFAGASIAGFFGAMGTVLLVYGLARAKSGFSSATLLLAGIAVNLFFSSLILLMQYFSDPGETFRMIRWLMGGFSVVGFTTPVNLTVFTVIGLMIAALMTREMNLLLTGEELAGARGVNVDRTKKLLFFSASLMNFAAGPVRLPPSSTLSQTRPLAPKSLAVSESPSRIFRLHFSAMPQALIPFTTPPSPRAMLKALNSLCEKTLQRSRNSSSKRRSGLSEPYFCIASS